MVRVQSGVWEEESSNKVDGMRAGAEILREKGSNSGEEREQGHISFLQHIFHVL